MLKKTPLRASVQNSFSTARLLIPKKFVTNKTLILIIALVSACLVLYWNIVSAHSIYLILLLCIPFLAVALHKVYQIVYDLKIAFKFDARYDVHLEFPEEKALPCITFIIPSYQEPFEVAKMTFDSVINTPYPSRKEIIVVDNSGDTNSEDFLKWKAYVEGFNERYPLKNITASFLYNPDKGKLKPGNLDLAQQHIRNGELVVFLDVDSTLPISGTLLEQAAAQFEADDRLGFIQFRIYAANNDFNALTRAVAISQDLLRLRMIARGYGGYKIFEGHNGIWRKSVLDKIGPWTEYYRNDIIITEDILKSAHAYAKGYYGKPLNIPTSEWVPSSLKGLEGMWMRWMYGNSQVFFKYVTKIYSKHTSFLEKVDISYHMLHHLVTLCFFIIVVLLQFFTPGHGANIFILLFGTLPQAIAATITLNTAEKKSKSGFFRRLKDSYVAFFLIDTFISCTQIKSDIKFFMRISQGWKVTEKGVEKDIGWRGLIQNTSFHFAMATASIVLCVLSWVVNYDMSAIGFFYHSALLFTSINLLACILVLGRKRRELANEVEFTVDKKSESVLVNDWEEFSVANNNVAH
jgi:cellulose synthase/poly-beta-1,6-N-acetylglucosamine synthase-like glycosyltransferase